MKRKSRVGGKQGGKVKGGRDEMKREGDLNSWNVANNGRQGSTGIAQATYTWVAVFEYLTLSTSQASCST